MIRVLIVDDSVVFRSQIKAALEGTSNIKVVGSAANGKIALDKIALEPVDLVILDLEMPEMNGHQFLTEIARRKLPQKVIVFAAPTEQGRQMSFKALAEGAVDVIQKPTTAKSLEAALEGIKSDLVPKILQFAQRHDVSESGLSSAAPTTGLTGQALDAVSSTGTPPPVRSFKSVALESFKPRVVVIGSSTGGPTALEVIFGLMAGKAVNVPILIAQHMPPHFTECLAKRLETISGIPSGEGRPGELVKPGRIYVAPGDYHMTVRRLPDGSNSIIHLDQSPKRNSVRPAVDSLFESVASVYGGMVGAFVLTGMGEDGMVGSKAIKQATGGVMIQNKASSVVWGMPGAVASAGALDAEGDLPECARILAKMVA
jgi:two-component system chemotaxis response regulator CheB